MTNDIIKHLENIIKHQTDQSSEDIILSAIDELLRLRSELADERVDQLLFDELWDRRTEMTDMNEQIKRLREERDEARREVLESMHPDLRNGYANTREWDCYKEKTDGR